MSSRIIRCLTALAVLSHSALGCCWHHGHGCAEHDGDVHLAANSCVTGGDNRGEQGRGGTTRLTGHADEPGHHNPCDEPDCAYLAAKASPFDPGLAASGWTASVLPAPRACGARSAVSRLDGRTASSIPPETLRALHQVWLL